MAYQVALYTGQLGNNDTPEIGVWSLDQAPKWEFSSLAIEAERDAAFVRAKQESDRRGSIPIWLVCANNESVDQTTDAYRKATGLEL